MAQRWNVWVTFSDWELYTIFKELNYPSMTLLAGDLLYRIANKLQRYIVFQFASTIVFVVYFESIDLLLVLITKCFNIVHQRFQL